MVRARPRGGGSDDADTDDEASPDDTSTEDTVSRIRHGLRRIAPQRISGGDESNDRTNDAQSTSNPSGDDPSSDSESNTDQLHGGQVDETDSTSGAGGTVSDDSTAERTEPADSRQTDSKQLHGGQVGPEDSTSGAGGTASAVQRNQPEQQERSDVVRESGAPSTDNPVVQARVKELRGRLEKRRADLDEGDYRIVVQDSGWPTVKLTEQGRRKQRKQQVREQLEEQYPNAESYEVRVTDDGEVVGTPQYGADAKSVASAGQLGEELLEQQIESENPDADVEVGRDQQGDFVVESTKETTSRQSGERYGGAVGRNKAKAARSEVEQFGLSDTVLERQAKTAEKQLEREYSNLDFDVRYTESGELKVENVEKKEQFGDVQVEVPFTGGETVEDYLEAGAEGYSDAVRGASSTLFDGQGIASESIIAEGLEAAGQDEAAAVFEERLRSFGKGTFEGAANLGNVPAVALGLKEAGEFVGYAGSKTLAGEGDEVADQTGNALVTAGAGAVDAFESNPAKVSGQLVGSLAGSYTAIAGASKVSSGAGRAAAYAIQPGEEIATGVATKLASRTATGSRVLSKLPGEKIDNEELAILAGRKAGRKLRNAVDDPRVKQFLRDGPDRGRGIVPDGGNSRFQEFLRDERGQGQLTLTKERMREQSDGDGDNDVSDLDAELERIRQKVADEDPRTTDEWLPDEGDTEVESEQTPTEDLRERETRERQESIEELAESTPGTDVRESDAELDQSEVGVEPGSRSKTIDETMREIDDLNRSLRREFELGTEAEVSTETVTDVGEIGRLEARTLDEERSLEDLQEDVQQGLDASVEAVDSRAAEEQLDQQVGVETTTESVTALEQDLATEQSLDQGIETELESTFESELAFESELDTEFETELEQEFEQERESEPFGDEDPSGDALDGLDGDGGLFSKEFENPVAALEEAETVAEEVDDFEEVFE